MGIIVKLKPGHWPDNSSLRLNPEARERSAHGALHSQGWYHSNSECSWDEYDSP